MLYARQDRTTKFADDWTEVAISDLETTKSGLPKTLGIRPPPTQSSGTRHKLVSDIPLTLTTLGVFE